jgi:hypothetical protein
MSIRKWHFGKLIILWVWGAMAASLALLDFQTSPVPSGPFRHLFELLFVLIILLVLSAITWHWLGDRPIADSDSGKATGNTEGSAD